jgi:hypothetical protein
MRETASNLRENTERYTQSECSVKKPRRDARTVGRHGIIQNELFSQSDSNRNFTEMRENSMQSD